MVDILIIAITIILTITVLLWLGEVRNKRSNKNSFVNTGKNSSNNGLFSKNPSDAGLFGKITDFVDKYSSDTISGTVKIGRFHINIGYILFAVILIVGTVVRVYDFGNNPPGLNQDEASGAYDAFSLAEYGVDRNGDRFPVHLVSWGSGQNALYAYIIIPFIKLFGLTEVTASLGNLIFGILTLILLFFSVKIIKNMEVALLSTFVLAISPWHIMLSRWGLPENILPSIVMIGIFFCALSFKKPFYFLLCSAFMALSLYAYGTAYIVVPGILLLYGLYELYFTSNKKEWFFKYTKAFLVFFTVSIPIIMFIYINVISPTTESIKLGFMTIPKLVETGTRYKQVVFLSGDYQNILSIL
ncbi:MAG: ArnT family glycosyltransferase, partial [Bacillota bacterium]